MGKFKVGDRVRFTADAIGIKLTGKTGTVIPDKDCVILPGEGATVQFDEPVEDFFEGGKRDWVWVFNHKLELIKPEKQPVIVITSDGKTTTATKRLGKKVIRSATARCSGDDTFDFNTGAKIAFERLLVEEWPVPKEDPIPEKLVCIWTCVPDFTKGKVYKTLRAPNRLPKVRDNDDYTWILSEEKVGGYYVDSFFEHQAQFIPLVED